MRNVDYFNKGNTENVCEDIFNKINEELEGILAPNIIIAGKTGVGKSTVVNSVFGEKLVQTGIGKPITQHLKRISNVDIPIVLYDTKGLELKEAVQKEVMDEIVDLVNSSRLQGREEDYMHAIWYCINGNSNRIEELEQEFIKELAESVDVPVIIVITQCLKNQNSKKFVEAIDNLNLNVKSIIPVMAEDFEIDENTIIPAYGLDELVKVTYSLIPESVQRGFINAQKISLELKIKLAKACANKYVASTFLTGFMPLPVADAPLLVGQQVTMLANITSIFGLPIDKAFLSTVVSSLLGSGSATLAGKFIVSNLLKVIPGVGTAIGGAISGGTASLLTAALARTYIGVMESSAKNMNEKELVSTNDLFKNIGKIFETELKTGVVEI